MAAAAAVGLVPEQRQVRVAYTAMHGVGAATLRRVFAAAGFDAPAEVAAQVEPDPEFPTVAFPNPEEPGALDLGLALARETDAHVLLANDPDADRLGVAVPDPGGRPVGWRALRGDEIGVVLADHLLAHDGVVPGGVLATTIVSSTLLGKMAAAAGVPYVETLTGFKWIGRAAGDRRHARRSATRRRSASASAAWCSDKDGITAAVVFAEAVAVLAAAGPDRARRARRPGRAHGVHQTRQWSVRVAGSDAMATMGEAMAGCGRTPPVELAGRAVSLGRRPASPATPPGASCPATCSIWHLDGARIVVRPSGTEPKLKAYVEVVEPVPAGDTVADVRAAADRSVGELVDAVAAATGLVPAQ